MNKPWTLRNAEYATKQLARNAREHRIIECCRRETERRTARLAKMTNTERAFFASEAIAFLHKLADVEYAALAVIDGIEGAEAELQAALEAADYHPLWVAAKTTAAVCDELTANGFGGEHG